jgi:quercetin dioxygenase-like cupin family protein
MAGNGYRRSTASDVHGFQHGDDNYWYQPLVFGTNLFTYLASVPPGGFMPPHGHEEDPYELSYYHLDGHLELSLEGEAFTVKPGDAVHIDPGVSLGVRNTSSAVARFLLTFNPPPAVQSIENMLARAQQRGSGVKSPEEMRRLAGSKERSTA